MNPMLYRAGFGQSSPSLLNLEDWQEKERVNPINCAVDKNGLLLDNLTLELRVTPPEITVDNTCHEKFTFVKLSSANRPGSLIHVVQHFTEMGLHIHSSRVTSCGGWFVDDFYLTEADGKKITNRLKLSSIQQMLSAYFSEEASALNGDETDDASRVESTVFELAGPDAVGLLADVTRLLTHNGCNVRSAAVWTYRGRVAFVLSVTEKGRPIADTYKLDRLRQLVTVIMGGAESSTIRLKMVRGEVHPDRRLHQLMLHEETELWHLREAGEQPAPLPLPLPRADADDGGSEASADTMYDRPRVEIEACVSSGYWIVNIACRDRPKLLFDTVCTLADLDYDIWHATIDALPGGGAVQEYHVRPRGGEGWDAREAACLRAMLESSIQRRFPAGVKLHVRSMDRFGGLADLTRVLAEAQLSITRAKVRTYATSNSSGHTFYVMGNNGEPPDRRTIQAVCSRLGGNLVDAGQESVSSSLGSHRFTFSFLNRSGGSPMSSSCGSV